MKILVFSDSHKSLEKMEEAIEKHSTDRIIFLGDCTEDGEAMKRFFPSKTIMIIKGNNDRFSEFPEKIICEFEGHKILCCHGHIQRVKSGLLRLKYEAKAENCDIALFGHTHLQFAEEDDGILFLNPGAVGFSGKYALLTLENGKKPQFILY